MKQFTLEQFKAWGRKGGKNTANKYDAKTRKEWGLKGGRPVVKNKLKKDLTKDRA